MNQFSEMEWNSKWDWENLVAFGSKAIESPKKLQLTDWTIVDDGEIDAGTFNLSAVRGNSGASGSDGGHVSSAKSSISASTTDSSTKDGMQTPNFRLMSFSGNFSDKTGAKGAEISRASPQADASIGSLEPLIGLKLGKRTYFENSSSGGNVKTARIPVTPTPSNNLVKKTKSSGQNLPVPHCLVEGCNIDLTLAKEYHRKHRVCDVHSKSPKVIVGGVERRFCQQCSRFHGLAEFDEKKRSCRRRLSDHNARRRKPPQEAVQFNSARLPSPFYEGRQQMGFLLNSSPYVYSRSPANNTWNSPCNSKFTITKGYPPPKAEVDGSIDCLMQIPGMKLPHTINMQDNVNNEFLEPKSSIPGASNPGSKGSSMISSSVDAAPDYRRALSLLSSNSWGSESIPPPVHHPLHENGAYVTQSSMQQSALPEGTPLSPLDLWLTGHHQATHPRPQPLAVNGNSQGIQLLKTPYEADFYSNIL